MSTKVSVKNNPFSLTFKLKKNLASVDQREFGQFCAFIVPYFSLIWWWCWWWGWVGVGVGVGGGGWAWNENLRMIKH